MSSSRFQMSLTGAPTLFEIQAASAMKSLRRRRPKPPPTRVMLTVTFASGIPRREHEGAGKSSIESTVKNLRRADSGCLCEI